MASKTRASGPSGLASRRSITASTARTESARATESRVGSVHSVLVKSLGLRLQRTVGGELDLLDLGLGFAELGLAMPLECRPALIGADRFIEPEPAGFELTDDAFQLFQRFFETHRPDLGQCCGLGHLGSSPVPQGREWMAGRGAGATRGGRGRRSERAERDK